MTKQATTCEVMSIKDTRALAKIAKAKEAEANFQKRMEEEVSCRVGAFLDQFRAEQEKNVSLTVIGQVKTAVKRNNLLSTIVGFVLGGFIPIATFCLVHYDLTDSMTGLRLLEIPLVLGGLIFSAKTCVAWTTQAFQDRVKAIAWVILLEGVMILSPIQQLAAIGLAILVVINGVATGCNLALQSRAV